MPAPEEGKVSVGLVAKTNATVNFKSKFCAPKNDSHLLCLAPMRNLDYSRGAAARSGCWVGPTSSRRAEERAGLWGGNIKNLQRIFSPLRGFRGRA